MNFIEKDLEDIIFTTPNQLLRERGLTIDGKKFRQVRIGNYGIADIITLSISKTFHKEESYHAAFVEHEIKITVYELKKEKIDLQALGQACRYIKGIERWLEKANKFQNNTIKYQICLVGSKVIANGDFVYITDYIMDNCDLFEYSYLFDGIKFKSQWGYSLKDENF